MKKVAHILCWLIVLWACKTNRLPQVQKTDSTKIDNEHTYSERIRDSIIIIPADSSWLKAYLACDSNGNVLLQQILDLQKGKSVQSPNIWLKNNQLNVKCVVDSFGVFIRFLSKIDISKISQKEVIKQEIKIPIITNQLTWQQKLWIKIGKIIIVLLLLFVIYKWATVKFISPIKLIKQWAK
ncbi:MAG: hypothetical protein JSR11_03635 [Bacteroidetes bacterium]|nr:hypothetical protein [Bacteroidota bacterium]